MGFEHGSIMCSSKSWYWACFLYFVPSKNVEWNCFWTRMTRFPYNYSSTTLFSERLFPWFRPNKIGFEEHIPIWSIWPRIKKNMVTLPCSIFSCVSWGGRSWRDLPFMIYPTTRYICSTRNQQAIQQYEHWWFGSVIWKLNGIPTRGFAFWMMTPNDKHIFQGAGSTTK